MYEEQTYDAIMTRLLAAVSDNLDKREGSFVWDALSPAALELAQAYINLELMLQRAFAATAAGQDLEQRTAEQGLTRKSATKAVGQLIFTGTDGAVIPGGTLAAAESGIQFETVQETVITGGQAAVAARAVKAGKKGNLPADSITVIPVAIAGITGVGNAEPFTRGYDAESDDELRERYFEKLRTPSTSGNKYHYIAWAREIPGVGDAKAVPLWNGPGTVKVIIIDGNKCPAGPELVADVAAYIEQERPIGAAVTVASAEGKTIGITAQVTLANGFTLGQVQDFYREAVIQYLKTIAFAETYVSYAQLGKILLETAGVGDYCDLLVNGAVNNVMLTDTETPVLGTVSLGV